MSFTLIDDSSQSHQETSQQLAIGADALQHTINALDSSLVGLAGHNADVIRETLTLLYKAQARLEVTADRFDA